MNKYIYQYSLKREKVAEIREEPMQSPNDIVTFLRSLELHEKEQEHMLVLFLDTKHKIKGYSVVSIGLVDRSNVHAREVYRNAILNGCSRIILAHNHPSGNPIPSTQDIACTRELVAAGKIIGIEVLDHVIIGNTHYSFHENNLL